MRVEVDTGHILEFPNDASEAEIDAGVNEFLQEMEASKPVEVGEGMPGFTMQEGKDGVPVPVVGGVVPPDAPKEPPSFLERVDEAAGTRIGQMQEIAQQAADNKISGPEALLRSGLKYAQILPDTAMAAVASGFSALPDEIEMPIREGASRGAGYIASLPVPGTKVNIGDVASSAVQEYQDFAERDPVTAGRLGSVIDVGNLAAPFVRVGGKSVINATESAAKPVVDLPFKAAGAATNKLTDIVLPKADEGLAEVAAIAKKHGIDVSFDQITSSPAVKNLQKVSQELPFSGQAGFRDKQMRQWQKAIFKTFGMEEEVFSPTAMRRAFEKVGGEFDSLTKGKDFDVGDQFINDISTLAEEMPSLYGADVAKTFEREAIKVLNDFQGSSIPGEVIAGHRARINALARKASPDNAAALRSLESAIIDGITSKDAALSSALSSAKHKYKNLIVVEPLAKKAKGGFISPSQLNSRVSQVYGRAHTIGDSGDIGELARVGNELLPTLGGSDTTQKLMYATGATGGAVVNLPLTAAVLGANRLGQRIINRNQSVVSKAANKRLTDKIPKSAPTKITITP